MTPMNIYAKPGTKVYFLGENGYESELNLALKMFEIGQELTVAHIKVGRCMSYVYFEGVPGSFNTVMFSELNPFKKKNGIKRIDGYQTTDNKIWNDESIAVKHQQYLNVREAIKRIGSVTYRIESSSMMHSIADELAKNRTKLYELLKDNV